MTSLVQLQCPTITNCRQHHWACIGTSHGGLCGIDNGQPVKIRIYFVRPGGTEGGEVGQDPYDFLFFIPAELFYLEPGF
jgi:hypothetical protein